MVRRPRRLRELALAAAAAGALTLGALSEPALGAAGPATGNVTEISAPSAAPDGSATASAGAIVGVGAQNSTQALDASSPISELDERTSQDAMLSAIATQREAALKAQRLAAIAAKKPGGKARSAAAAVDAGGPIPTVAVTPKTKQVRSLIRKHFPDSQIGNAMATAACESGHADAVGALNSDGTRDWGVFQLNDGGTLQGSLSAIGVSYSSTAQAQKLALNTEINIRAAAKIYATRGWSPWVCAYKIRIVAGLYASAPGPMYGKFDTFGRPTIPVPIVEVGPSPGGKPDSEPPKKKARKPKRPGKKPNPGGSGGKRPKPKPKPSPTAKPAPTPSPTLSPTPSPSGSAPGQSGPPGPSASGSAHRPHGGQ